MRTFHGLFSELATGSPHQEDNEDSLVLAFGAREALTEELVATLRASFPNSVVAGCSTAGHFLNSDLFDEEETVVLGARFEHTRLREATVALDDASMSQEAGEKLAADLSCDGLRAVLVLSDGTNCNGSALVAGLVSILPEDTVVFGGLAADGADFVETSVIGPHGANPGQVTAIGFAGDRLEVRTGSRGGWDLFGPERTITRSIDSTLLELDGEPALDLYRRYLGDRADDLPGSALLFPLAIRAPEADFNHQLVRTVLGVDTEDRTMTFAGDMPEGWRAQLMRASFDALVDGAEDAANIASWQTEVVGDQLCLGVSCVGRRLVLGSRTEDELDVVAEVFEGTATLVGFYSYGELAPGHSGTCELHNQTMTLTTLGER